MKELLWFMIGLSIGSFIMWVIYGKDKEEDMDDVPTYSRNKDKVF